MLQITSVTPAGGIEASPTTIRISDDPNVAYANPDEIYVNFNYSNNTSGPVFIFLEGVGVQIVTGSFYYDADNDPLTNPGMQSKDGSEYRYAFRYLPGKVSNLELYMQQTDINGSYGSVVERVTIPGQYLYVGSSTATPTPTPTSTPAPTPDSSPTPSPTPTPDAKKPEEPIRSLLELEARTKVDKLLGGRGGHVLDAAVGNKDWVDAAAGEIIDPLIKYLKTGSRVAAKAVPYLQVVAAAADVANEALDRSNKTGASPFSSEVLIPSIVKGVGNSFFPGAGDAAASIADYVIEQQNRSGPETRLTYLLKGLVSTNKKDATALNKANLVGGSRTDDLRGSSKSDRIFGNDGDDSLKGASGHDVLIGGNGNDRLIGNDGIDMLNGVGSKYGRAEIDRLTGGEGADVYVLGNSKQVFYDDKTRSTRGDKDYALITNFNANEDGIVLKGNLSQYVLRKSGSKGHSIFLDDDGIKGFSRNDELIAQVKGFANLSQLDFIFV